MKKFNWLQNKQKIRRKNFHKQNSKKLKNKNKYDRNRYRSRQKFKIINNLIDSAKENVLNKSSINITDNQLILLNHGLNFVPTPQWTEEIEKKRV